MAQTWSLLEILTVIVLEVILKVMHWAILLDLWSITFRQNRNKSDWKIQVTYRRCFDNEREYHSCLWFDTVCNQWSQFSELNTQIKDTETKDLVCDHEKL